jgi:hypothetical protein
VHQLIGVTPPSEGGLVTITRTRKSRKLVPKATGRVRLKLRLNNLGRLLLKQQATPTVTISVRARMTLTTPVNGKVVGANRTIVLRRRR